MKGDQIGPEEDAVRQQLMRYIPSFGGQTARKADGCVEIFRYMMIRNYQISRTVSSKRSK